MAKVAKIAEPAVSEASSTPVEQLARLPRAALRDMLEAGQMIRESYRVLGRTKDNIVGEVLRNNGTFFEWKHYPPGDIYDHASHSQYYYHAHKKGARGGEHGHFHTFLRAKGMAPGVVPCPNPGATPWPQGDEALSHLVGVAMDRAGFPIGLFTTNRWVTGECWYAARDVAAMLPRFEIDHARPSWPVNRWLTAMLVLFRPMIEELVHERDATLERWRAEHPDTDVYEDRGLEVMSERHITVEAQIASVEAALGR